ncbi:MAG TPA: lysylphosphatidylglycerol synthase transmembrane domain-containing protein [Acidimicrobiales bacterium]|nr:lysylphosphatidylglycerol synthase transmembrane domain-containing protein [Acidimicrobiales bacterium]
MDAVPDPHVPGAGSRRAWAARISAVVGLVVVALAVAFVARRLAADWTAVRAAVADASVGWVAVGLGLAVLAMAGIGWAWADVLALLGVRAGRGRVVAWYFVGELGKYLPGGVWPVVGRGEMARRGGVPRATAYASVALSLVTLYLAAMLLAVALLPFALGGDGPGGAAVVLALLPLGLAALHPRALAPVLALARRVSGRALDLPVPRWRDSVATVVRYLPTWVAIAGATVALARALDPGAPVARVAFAALLSWIAGFLAVPAPGGAGVREAVFTAASGLEPEIGAAVAVIARVAFVLVDGGGAALAAAALRRAGRPGDTDGDPRADPVGPRPTPVPGQLPGPG